MEISFPFDAHDLGGVPDRRYSSADVAAVARLLFSNGVLGTNGLKITAGTGLAVEAAPGGAVIDGRFYALDTAKTLPIEPNTSGNDRIDAVVLRLDHAARAIYPTVIAGTPAAQPERPSPLCTDAVHDILLAAVLVPNACESIGAGYVTALATPAAGI